MGEGLKGRNPQGGAPVPCEDPCTKASSSSGDQSPTSVGVVGRRCAEDGRVESRPGTVANSAFYIIVPGQREKVKGVCLNNHKRGQT